MTESDGERRKMLLASLGAIVAQLGAPEASAQDPTRVMPRAFRIAFENDKVRVLDFRGRPGMGVCGDGMHSHPAHLTIVLDDWTGVATDADGKVVNRDRKRGDVFWSEAETHKVENTGTRNSRVLIVELKESAGGKA